MIGVLIYGPPASGKSTITRELEALEEPVFRSFQRLKVGRGRQDEYRMTTHLVLDTLRQKGDLIWENSRYGATYAIDRPELLRAAAVSVPVVHVGQEEAVDALISRSSLEWMLVELRCPRETAFERIVARATGDAQERMVVWDQTAPLSNITADLVADTAASAPREVAKLIRLHLASRQAGTQPALHLTHG